MRTVRFVKDYPPHTKGQLAQVSDEEAAELAEAGVAVLTKMFEAQQTPVGAVTVTRPGADSAK